MCGLFDIWRVDWLICKVVDDIRFQQIFCLLRLDPAILFGFWIDGEIITAIFLFTRILVIFSLKISGVRVPIS